MPCEEGLGGALHAVGYLLMEWNGQNVYLASLELIVGMEFFNDKHLVHRLTLVLSTVKF